MEDDAGCSRVWPQTSTDSVLPLRREGTAKGKTGHHRQVSKRPIRPSVAADAVVWCCRVSSKHCDPNVDLDVNMLQSDLDGGISSLPHGASLVS